MIAKTLTTFFAFGLFANPAFAQSWEQAPGPDDAAETESEESEPIVTPETPSAPVTPAEETKTKPEPSRELEQPRHRHHHRWHRSGGGLSLSIGKARVTAEALDERLRALGYEPLSDR